MAIELTESEQAKWDAIYQQSMDKYALDVETTMEALRETEIPEAMQQSFHDAVNNILNHKTTQSDAIEVTTTVVAMITNYRKYLARHDADMG